MTEMHRSISSFAMQLVRNVFPTPVPPVKRMLFPFAGYCCANSRHCRTTTSM